AGGDEAGDVRHVDPEDRADFIGDLAHARPVFETRIRRETTNDHFRFGFERDALHFVVVDHTGFGVETVRHDFVVFAREVGRVAVGEVAALRQVHAHHGVAGADQREEDGGVGLCARMRLYVGVV